MVFLSWNTSRNRLREAENARRNRLEIVKARSIGQISRRDLIRWGIFTGSGLLVAKNGLSPYASSAYGQVPTGTPRSPVFGARKFNQPMPRLVVQKPVPLTREWNTAEQAYDACFPVLASGAHERHAKKYSWHQDWYTDNEYRNPVTNLGPCEGRPPGDYFIHQRWSECHPKVGYVLSLGQVRENSSYYVDPSDSSRNMPSQNANALWSFGPRPIGMPGAASGTRIGSPVPLLIKARYGEPILTRIYNDLPVDRAANGGFGRNEISTHYHNAHNGAESDGACNAYHFPGTFYDYHWSSMLARHDLPNVRSRDTKTAPGTSLLLRDLKASGPDDSDGVNMVPGDFRELQGTMWFHDHRFFFTAENVHKGNFSNVNMYSGPDRGSELADRHGINHRLPSGTFLPWGNIDFDVNLDITNPAFDRDGQLFFDIFDTEGFLGDILATNGAYYPYFEVLPRKYRFRILNASMARFLKLAFVDAQSGQPLPMQFIANDGNFVVNPITLSELDVQGVAERYDVVVDFSRYRGQLAGRPKVRLINLLKQTDGRKPDGPVSIAKALRGIEDDPCVGPVVEFRVVPSVQSVDDPTFRYDVARTNIAANRDASVVPAFLTEQIPLEAPVRTRELTFGRSGGGDSRDADNGECIPECGDIEQFPWTVKVNGQAAHSLNANRISVLVPRPGEVEYWTLVNGGGGWDHPIHLHFEEGVTIDRGGDTIPATERLVRKDVWRLRPSGRVTFQVRFGEFGGAYVNHCHNTTHEDFAMLLRYQLLRDEQNGVGDLHYQLTPTPIPSPAGVTFKQPEILPEGDPRRTESATTSAQRTRG